MSFKVMGLKEDFLAYSFDCMDYPGLQRDKYSHALAEHGLYRQSVLEFCRYPAISNKVLFGRDMP
jgi:hypothetical protein